MKVVSVNVGKPASVEFDGKTIRTAMGKRPVAGPCVVDRHGLAGDGRVEQRRFGDAEQALCVYPQEHYAHWARAGSGVLLNPGDFGENLTVVGFDERQARIGDVLRCGSSVVQVTHPRIPCRKLDVRMGPGFSGRFLRSRRVGYYLRVLHSGHVCAGDSLVKLSGDPRSPTVDEFLRVSQIDYWDADGLDQLRGARDLCAEWQAALGDKLDRARGAPGWFGTRELVVTDRHRECPGIFTVELRCPASRALSPFIGGQVLTLSHRPTETSRALRRAFPISGPSADRSCYRITLRTDLGDPGRGDELLRALDRDLLLGATVRATAPRGSVTLDRVQPSQPVAFFGESLGMARVMGLVHAWTQRPDLGPARVFHRATGPSAQVFVAQLDALARRHRRLEVLACSADLQPHSDWLRGCFAYVFGSEAFCRPLVSTLSQLGFEPGPPGSCHVEVMAT